MAKAKTRYEYRVRGAKTTNRRVRGYVVDGWEEGELAAKPRNYTRVFRNALRYAQTDANSARVAFVAVCVCPRTHARTTQISAQLDKESRTYYIVYTYYPWPTSKFSGIRTGVYENIITRRTTRSGGYAVPVYVIRRRRRFYGLVDGMGGEGRGVLYEYNRE